MNDTDDFPSKKTYPPSNYLAAIQGSKKMHTKAATSAPSEQKQGNPAGPKNQKVISAM